MAENALLQKLKLADEEIIKEILRQAELRLDSQLTAALASDSRAMSFFGFVIALLAVTLGSSLAGALAQPFAKEVVFLSVVASAGLAVTAYLAFEAAKPIDFHFPGSYPSVWDDDVAHGIKLRDALAEQCCNYDKSLKFNRECMKRNADTLLLAKRAVLWTLAVTTLSAFFVALTAYVP